MSENFYEVKSSDVGEPLLRCFGTVIDITNALGGQLTHRDVGKRVYLRTGSLCMENDEQIEKRVLGPCAKEALLAQSAYNLGGVLLSFRESVLLLYVEAQRIGQGTDWVHRHPIVTLFTVAIGEINKGHYDPGGSVFFDALGYCQKLDSQE